ncbi:2-amino-4-hydroxy-6-hydroxymethyldihydropteridine diphosphokinase [Altererythrobacter salegens]|uniref:2-amino-4-hydroxy-6-hydroxymethyldihydropteridine pyrophosphokinase n=1 Tax=Croceibacterium salegens TaxID=1737568 RepID=A0A6I4SXV9_9SPHN|nr:2-amino-4-hydroxy-6-hydroxymethyldihydropteridine diphosphokinase [Croceibacterium salegens]MXO59696.1 2-amino-4-hydroxy-6-hydroxymethyldihydropteridine diphosphokinase [Croceibacterium salegens]
MPAATAYRYLIALGSNVRHVRHGSPRRVLAAALQRLQAEGVEVLASATPVETAPVGPSIRRYANSAAVIETDLDPPALLALLKCIERDFGRRSGGQRWRARVLDIDIVLWSGGCFGASDLVVPHPLFRERSFVLAPAVRIAPDWRDPVTGLSISQLHARLTHTRTLPR